MQSGLSYTSLQGMRLILSHGPHEVNCECVLRKFLYKVYNSTEGHAKNEYAMVFSAVIFFFFFFHKCRCDISVLKCWVFS